MAVSLKPHRPVNGRACVAETIFPPPDAQRRQPARSSARREPVPLPFEHWSAEYQPRTYGPAGHEIERAADTGGIDALIAKTWRMHEHHLLTFDEAGEQHHALVEMRDGRAVR